MRFSVLLQFLIVTTAVQSAVASSHASETATLTWTNQKAFESCSLTVDFTETSSLRFLAKAGKKPMAVFDVPFRNRLAHQGNIYAIPSPWKEGRRTLIDQTPIRQATEAKFDQNIQHLLDLLIAGNWAEITLTDTDKRLWSQEISTIGINPAMQAFDDCRNALPPIGLETINSQPIWFSTNRVGLTDSDRRYLDQIAEYLSYNKDIQTILLDGHTDVTGERLVNLQISRKRAEAVRDYLFKRGVPKEMIPYVRWHGERYPYVSLNGQSRQANNRRVEIQLLTTPPPELDPEQG
ncbi:OmpA family protein [Parendozoicomonas haliclonae]|uniref:Peptidoglycan-binding protein ArfA n=1 Tax=Parendozoicomonas haliclonae TaxID=1960125 RepID=A0A1X7AMV4_9GAMM|nr:OmpA family protein [Parendozoicomonas haliclonae]SMA49624.1 Peptidoglycan-binding protein ArfA [Parendozoicomonas haliclonae]